MNPLRTFFEDLAGRWDAQQPADRLEVLSQLLAPFAVMLDAAGVILEVGTGTGALIPCLKERAPAARLVSIDLAYDMPFIIQKHRAQITSVRHNIALGGMDNAFTNLSRNIHEFVPDNRNGYFIDLSIF